MKYATVADGTIDAIYLYDPRPDVEAIEVSDTVFGGFISDGSGGWMLPPIPPQSEANLIAYVAAKRWAVQTGGITVGGIAIDTSDASRSMIADAVAYVQAAGVPSVEFKSTSGWVTLSTAEVVAIGLAVGAHVQQCFAAERAVALAIDAGTITTTAEIDAFFRAAAQR